MKKIFKMSLHLVLGAMMLVANVACEDSEGGIDVAKEDAFKAAVTPYVNNTVIATYKNMADAAIEMNAKCEVMKKAFATRSLTTEMVKEAGAAWNNSRKYWELSEAFLFGPANDYSIDPHIDSWPLDKPAMETMLNNKDQMALLEKGGIDYILSVSGYGLLGFHAVEYMLFELDATEENSLPRSISKYTSAEMVYLTAVATDLRNQCIRLEASWAGMDNVTSQKQTILTDAELEPTRDYGWSMQNPGQGGSVYKNNYLEVAQEIIDGCITIADEVGNQKIGRPVNGSSADDKNYIESPYSLNSVADFTDNVISIRNSYQGSREGDASLSDYIITVDAALDAKLKATIEKAIATIKQIPEPFAKSAKTHAKAKEAVTVVGTDLVNVLGEVNQALSKY